MFRAGLLAVSLMLFGWVLPGVAQPSLVKDVNPDPVDPQRAPSSLSDFTSLGSRAVFLVGRNDEVSSGSELWTTDGTDAGTEKLRSFFDFQTSIAGGNGRVAFVFVTAVYSYPPPDPVASLWRTDGTAEGTFPLARMITAFRNPMIHGGSLFFVACPTANDCEPWVSDGTVGGTQRLRDITPGEYGSDPREFFSLNDRVYFFANAPDGPGLWQTDGTRRGTRRVALLPPYSVPRELTAASGRLFFAVGKENSLWTSDGTEEGTGPVPPFDRPRGRGPAVSRLLGAVGGSEYFSGVDPALGPQLYRTDGTPGGTRRLSSFPRSDGTVTDALLLEDRLLFVGPDFKLWTSGGSRASTHPLSGCPGGCPVPDLTYEGRFKGTVSGGLAFFSGILGNDVEPWVTDGTPAGTRRLLDVCRDGQCGSYPMFGPVVHGEVLFQADRDLWATDGTVAGTRRLGEGIQVPEGVPVPVAAAGSRLVFAGFDKGAPDNAFLAQLKSVEGTPASEHVLDLPLNDGLGSNPRAFTKLGDDVLFFVCSPTLGGIWKTRGTPETTTALTDVYVGCGGDGGPPPITVLDGVAYFLAIPPEAYWFELWRTDGTPEGTWQVTQVGPARYVTAFTQFQGRLLFVAQDQTDDPTLVHSSIWASDGTAAGTGRLFDLSVRYVFSLSAFGNAVYFQGQSADYTDQLYVSDGTAAGTRALARAGETGSTDFLDFGGETLFLSSEDYGSLWKTDGTPEGTRKIALPGNPVQNIADLAQYGGRLYFIGLDIPDPESGREVPTLFRSDGTTAGTVRLKAFTPDFTPDYAYFPPPQFAALAGALYFVALDSEHGGELWRTDGTAAGTVLVTDLNPGPDSARVSGLLAVGDRLFFAADDGEHGVELWTSDGTAAGTRRLGDLAPGASSSSPRELAVIGDRLFFSADDGVIGREPWVLSLPSLASALAGKGKP